MCGIAGQINFNQADVSSEELGRMQAALQHRGPDGKGVFIDQNVGLAHTRLKIFDLSESAAQPMYSDDKFLALVYNGEIYNFLELKEQLQAKGHRFRTKCDTEVLLHCYEEYGEECLQRFNGEFAFCLYDRRKKRMFCARDRLGIKPFYYHLTESAFIFASELKALVTNPMVTRVIDRDVLNIYFDYGYSPGDGTLLRGIKKLRPGYYLVVDSSGKVEEKKYWDVQYTNGDNQLEDCYLERLDEHIKKAVQLRLRSDVPLGLFLSGGLDSSALLSYMRSLTSGSIKTYSIGFNQGGKYNESVYAEQVARLYGTDHHSYILKPTDFCKIFKTFSFMMDEPVIEAPSIALFYLAKQARSEITVALSGEGSDELFAGYIHQYLRSKRESDLSRWPMALRQLCLNVVDGASSHYWTIRMRNIRRDLWFSVLNEEDRILSSRQKDYTMRQYVGMPIVKNKNFLERARKLGSFKNKDRLNGVLNYDLKTYLPDRLLIKADRATMANALELRVPFLDHNLVEYAATLPIEMKLGPNNTTKYILKQIMTNRLPEEIIRRPKVGFAVPVAQLIRDDLKDFFGDILLSKKFSERGYFNYKRVRKIFESHVAGSADFSDILWQLLVLEQWHRCFIDREN